MAAHALDALPVEPSTATWITYIRCHDDIGWAIGDADAAAVGLNGYWHRVFLADWYRGSYPMSDARGLVFQYNPVTNDRRIAGTAALASRYGVIALTSYATRSRRSDVSSIER